MTCTKHIILLFLLLTGLAGKAQIINTIAGTGQFGLSGDGGPAINARIYGTSGLTMDNSGNLYIADMINNRIRKIDPSGIITTFAGSADTAVIGSYRGDGGPATAAGLYWPAGVAIDHYGNILIADAMNNRIRRIDPAGIISTFAGTGSAAFSGDGGPATAAGIRFPCDVAVDRFNNIYIADAANNRIRRIDTHGTITTVAGNGDYASIDSGAYYGDGGPATAAALYQPHALALDTNGNIFIADMMNNCIRKVTPAGIITTYAGSGLLGYSGDNGPATLARMVDPSGIAFDSLGNLYIADGGNNRIRAVSPSGIIGTIAGTGIGGFSGDGDVDTLAQLFSPTSVMVDKASNIYISDASNYRIRKITPPEATGINTQHTVTSMGIYPNPSSSSVTLHLAAAHSSIAHITITNNAGQIIKELQAPANKNVTLQLDALPGIYFINAHVNGTAITRKLVIAP